MRKNHCNYDIFLICFFYNTISMICLGSIKELAEALISCVIYSLFLSSLRFFSTTAERAGK